MVLLGDVFRAGTVIRALAVYQILIGGLAYPTKVLGESDDTLVKFRQVFRGMGDEAQEFAEVFNRATGMSVRWPLQDMSYGTREFGIADCNGYTLAFAN